MIKYRSAVVVKYNPCTKYARGSECRFFQTTRKCGKERLQCGDPSYDKWYKLIKLGRNKSFYPKRISILENPGVPFFLYHIHHKTIVGEATVTKATEMNGDHYYWFDRFTQYPFPVPLELLETDKSLQKLARIGRWRSKNISKQTVEEIRSLSKLPDSRREELGKVFDVIVSTTGPRWRIYMDFESRKSDVSTTFSKPVLDKTKLIFSEAVSKRINAGRSLDTLFYASLYLANRLFKKETMLSDIALIRGLDSRKLAKCYRELLQELEIKVSQIRPENLIEEYASKLSLSSEETKTASRLAYVWARTQLKGKAPSSLAATAVYMVCQAKRTKKEISRFFGVSEVTMSNLSRQLRRKHSTDQYYPESLPRPSQ